jgi:hypothetical protein
VVFFKKKINKIINKTMTALGEIQDDYQKIRSGATRSQVEAPAPGTPGVTPGAPDETERPGSNYVDTLKKYAPYIIGGIALYYLILKK